MKDKSPSKEDIRHLLARLNEYARAQDTPANVEDLKMVFVEGKVETSFRLVPLGDMDTKKWFVLNQVIEKKIQEFLAGVI